MIKRRQFIAVLGSAAASTRNPDPVWPPSLFANGSRRFSREAIIFRPSPPTLRLRYTDRVHRG
jgi:hypothetical protein